MESREQPGLTYGMTCRNFTLWPYIKAYKIQLVQKLKLLDLHKRKSFEKFQKNSMFLKQILFSDKAHFWLNGYVNSHHFRIWEIYTGVFNINATEKKKATGTTNDAFFLAVLLTFFFSKAISWWKNLRTNNELQLLKFSTDIWSQWPQH